VATAHSGRIEQLWAEIERYLAGVLGSERAVVLVRAGASWRPWNFSESAAEEASYGDDLPNAATTWKGARRLADSVYVPILPGAVCALVLRCHPVDEWFATLDLIATSLAAAAMMCEQQMVAAQNLDDVQALQRVATRILKSHDLPEIMQLITLEAKRLLSADICGIMLREGDEIVMQRCVGNFSIATASLRMRQGQGIAGQVFVSQQPCRVEDYLRSEEISRDFFALAQDEKVRSALAAPLLSRDEVIGVLEVWRRRPSIFTDLETTRLVALANLVSIAIENARLYAAKQTTLHELERANEALVERYDVVRSLVELTQDLVQLLLGEQGLAAIADKAAQHLQANVLIVDRELQVVATAPPACDFPPAGLTNLRDALQAHRATDERPFLFSAGPAAEHCMAQAIYVAKELMGHVVVYPGRSIDDATSLAIGQIVLATALYNLQQRSASRARSETLDAIVWDLLEGSDKIRHAALDRLREMKIELPSSLRVLLVAFEVPSESAGASSMQLAASEERRRLVRNACLESEHAAFKLDLVGARGELVAVLLSEGSVDSIEQAASRIARKISGRQAGVTILLGVSAPSDHPRALPRANREARISLDVAKQRGRSGVVVYDKSGVVGLLFSVKQNVGIHGLVDSTLGALMKQDDKYRHQLLETLRVYFDLNCSQEAAAQRLGVHRKTIGYRIARITELTGLDLSTHDDRLLADLALYVHATISPDSDPASEPGDSLPRAGATD
jgi:sugar diacid utilization regulator/putative methionine-R-sulfoxide reductase with GAF domain